jgi:predicted unusual protein kinase regulating ubiquinone biosynthesis (AarF/ABC1/UbiB family)
MLRSRYRRILFFFAGIIIRLVYWDVLLPRLGLKSYSQRGRSERLRNIAVRFRALAITMGGVMIKVGQFLSARVDILPPEFTTELEGLQDEVPAIDFNELRKVAEQDFGVALDQVFFRIDEQPVAAASIGQVHRAWLLPPDSGEVPLETPAESIEANQEFAEPVPEIQPVQVIVKIQRPNIENIVRTDLAALDRVGSWLQWYAPIRKRANIPALLTEFATSLFQEMDYIQEGKNAERFAENFAERPRIRVPRVAWRYTTERVITLEDVTGIKITDYEQITAMQISRAEVASLLFQTYMQQVFFDQFFHADPHPGNLFVLPGQEIGAMGRDWQLVFVDFGMMGEVTVKQRTGLREMAIAITTQDAARAVKAYNMMGFLLPNANLTLIESAGTYVFDRFWGKSTQELQNINIDEVINFTQEYRDLMYELPFQVPNQMLLLGRALAILSGICAGLDPDFNVWTTMLPYAQELISEERTKNWDFWRGELDTLQRNLLRLPGRLNNILVQIERGELTTRNPNLDDRVNHLEHSIRQLGGSIIASSLLIIGTILLIQNYTIPGIIALAGTVVILLWNLLSRRNSNS